MDEAGLSRAGFIFLLLLFEGRLVVEVAATHHFDAVLVGEDGEVGLRLKEQYVALLGVFGKALDGATGHHDAALAVGAVEQLVADALIEEVGALMGDYFAAVAEDNSYFGFAQRGKADDVVDGDELLVGSEHAHASVGHHAVLPALVDGELAFFVVLVGAVLEALEVVAFAGQEVIVVIFDKGAFETAVDIGTGDVALGADALPPAAVAMVVAPMGHLGGVAFGGVDDMEAVLDAHAVGGFFDESAVLGIELPEAVAVAAVVVAAGQQVALLVVGLMVATHTGFGIDVADADGAVGVVIKEGAGFQAVNEVTFVDFGAVFVGANPMALASALGVDFVLCGGTEAEEHQRGHEEDVLFHAV